jgi:hypothetical protein
MILWIVPNKNGILATILKRLKSSLSSRKTKGWNKNVAPRFVQVFEDRRRALISHSSTWSRATLQSSGGRYGGWALVLGVIVRVMLFLRRFLSLGSLLPRASLATGEVMILFYLLVVEQVWLRPWLRLRPHVRPAWSPLPLGQLFWSCWAEYGDLILAGVRCWYLILSKTGRIVEEVVTNDAVQCGKKINVYCGSKKSPRAHLRQTTTTWWLFPTTVPLRAFNTEISEILAQQVLGGQLSVVQHGHSIRLTLSDEDRRRQQLRRPQK